MKNIVRFLVGFALVLAVLALAGGSIVLGWYLKPIDSSNQEITQFVVSPGQSTIAIGVDLHEKGFIRHPLLFRLAVQIEGLAGKIQAGSFEISRTMTPAEIAHTMTQGTQDVWITVLEGWRLEQIAESLASLDLPFFDTQKFISIAKQENSEGRLFPDTYLIPRQYTESQIHALLTTTFEQKIVKGLSEEIANSPHSLDDIITMASLVEREAREYEEMRGVAGVLWHRIEIGMPLQVDATMQYAKGFDEIEQSWWVPPRAEDKAIDSPFNTYRINGLPPAPIANPGLQAIRATLNPQDTDNLFYIHDRTGKIHYAQTLEGHNANINRYLR